jgi:hypothetical protein
MDKLSELTKQIAELKKKEFELQEKKDKIEDRRDRAISRKLIGKCFKYQNSWGGEDKWWLYSKVVGTSTDNRLCVVQVETTPLETKISFEDYAMKGLCQTGITLGEFNTAYKKATKKIIDKLRC